MKTFTGRPVLGGIAKGPGLTTNMPINFTASFTKPANLLPNLRSRIHDRHHDLFKQKIKDKVLIFPSAIGSTYTGMVLLDVIQKGAGPAAMIVGNADSLLISGSILANVWFEKTVPVIEIDLSVIEKDISTDTIISVNGDNGEIRIEGHR